MTVLTSYDLKKAKVLRQLRDIEVERQMYTTGLKFPIVYEKDGVQVKNYNTSWRYGLLRSKAFARICDQKYHEQMGSIITRVISKKPCVIDIAASDLALKILLTCR